MRLIDMPVYASVRAFLSDTTDPVVLDIGANRGEESRAMLREFPRGTVHAFEPSARCFADLEGLGASEPRLRPHRMAVGARDGVATLLETQSDVLSSLLPLTELGEEHFGVRGEVRERVDVPCVRLDTWARRNGIERIDFIKIDVQGSELDVLKGLGDLLDGVRAIYSEAQILQEYVGAATLTDLDLFLRERGFSLHQFQEIHSRGPEHQVAHVDVLWVRDDVLARRRAALMGGEANASHRLSRALRSLAESGARRVAIYGAGEHTARAARAFFDPPVEIVAIIDDSPARQGGCALGVPIVGLGEAARMGVDAVVVSSDAHEAALCARATSSLPESVDVVTLYGTPARTGALAGARA